MQNGYGGDDAARAAEQDHQMAGQHRQETEEDRQAEYTTWSQWCR